MNKTQTLTGKKQSTLRGPGDLKIGVINPFALVELKLKRRIDWSKIADHRLFIEHMLDFPYDKLFDPKHGSPLYTGVKDDGKKVQLSTLLNKIRENDRIALEAGVSIFFDRWVDPGHFFNSNPADYTDPIQGALPNCHFISAMASIAWAKPYSIAQRTRPIADTDTFESGKAVDMISFFSGTGAAPTNIEVTELLPLLQPGNVYQYARSIDPEETWPAIYEKAWVKWFTNDAGDRPDYSRVGGGDPVQDMVNLTGLTPNYRGTTGMTGDQIYGDVRSNSRGAWTFNPMVAWTYGSADDAPTPINYNTAGIVADHAYSILGWMYHNNQEYIILRNPWGNTAGTLNTDAGPWESIEQIATGFRRILSLPANGVFALRADAFQEYYAGYGWVD